MTRIAWLPVAWTLGCTSPQAPTVLPAATAPTEPPPPATVASSAAEPPPPSAPAPDAKAPPIRYRKQDLESAACTKRLQSAESPCRAVEWLSGGTDSAGRELVVVKLALFDGPGTEEAERRETGACDHFQYWLVPVTQDRTDEPQLLLGICNDGYGVSGVGEDTIEVLPNTFQHSQYGGSAWRWFEKYSVSLSPLRPRSAESNGYWNLGAHFLARRFDWDKFGGRQAWYTPYCKADGEMDESQLKDDELTIGGDLESPGDYAFAYEFVPAVTLDPKFVKSPESVELGSCALTLDAGKTTGFVLEGTAGEPSDTSLSVVASADGTRLYIEVKEVVWTARPQPHFDRLELWSSDGEPRTGSHCIEPPKAKISAFDIDLTGRVDRQRGRAPAPKVSVPKATPGTRRLVLSWQKPLEHVTLVYSDSDDGTSVKRRISTSKLRPDNPDSLGYVHPIQASEATCQVREGRLEPVVTLSFEPRTP